MSLQEVQERGLLRPIGNHPAFHWPETVGRQGAAEDEEVLCWVHRKGDAADTQNTFTAGFQQRHQILGHSSHAQPVSLVKNPVAKRGEGLTLEGLEEAVSPSELSPWENRDKAVTGLSRCTQVCGRLDTCIF